MGIRWQFFFQKSNSGQLMNHKVNIGKKFLFSKFEGCSWARKSSVTFLIFHTFAYNSLPRTGSILRKKYRQMHGKLTT